MKLYLTDEAFHAAHLVADTGRKASVTIKRSMLINLLMDHSRLVALAQKHGEKIEKGKPDGNDARR